MKWEKECDHSGSMPMVVWKSTEHCFLKWLSKYRKANVRRLTFALRKRGLVTGPIRPFPRAVKAYCQVRLFLSSSFTVLIIQLILVFFHMSFSQMHWINLFSINPSSRGDTKKIKKKKK